MADQHLQSCLVNRADDDWRKGIILPFWNRKGDALTCSNHRGIALLSIPGKTFARVVINRAIPAMHHHRRPHQAGFMPGRSTADHISAILLLAEKAREFRKDRTPFIAFIDLKRSLYRIWCGVNRLGDSGVKVV